LPCFLRYHGVLAVKGFGVLCTLAAYGRLRPLTAVLRRGSPVLGQIRPKKIRSCAMSNTTDRDIVSSLRIRDTRGRYQNATAEQILAAARQVIDQQYARGTQMSSPQSVCEYLKMKLSGYPYEVFSVLYLDAQHRLIEYVELFRGTINEASVYPREVIKETLARNAAAVIFSHNHPSGTPEPSWADRALTRRLKDALALIDIRVLDHIVVGGADTVSFSERGWL
jgi:DNA repair protein RadC